MKILATIFKVAIDILCIYLIIYEVLRIFSISEMFSALSWSFFFFAICSYVSCNIQENTMCTHTCITVFTYQETV